MNSRNGNPAAAAKPDSRPVRIVAPYPFTYTFRVKPTETGTPLLQFLLQRFPFRSAPGWQERITDGRIRCNGEIVHSGKLLKQGDLIAHHNPRVTEPSVPDAVRILQETDSWLIVFKPAPMPVHAGGRYTKNTLIEILNEMTDGPLHIIHRLDSVTSGLMLIGKNAEFSHKASVAFKQGHVEKSYFALSEGIPKDDVFRCDFGIRREKGYRFTCAEDGKQALTEFRTIKRGAARSIVQCEPITGRTHQIRLHLAALGHPVYDDYIYRPDGGELLQNSAISLQSSVLRIPTLDVNYAIDVPSDWNDKL